MWKSYFKIVGRHLLKSVATPLSMYWAGSYHRHCLLILIYVQDEWSYDQWHQDGDRIYRMVLEWKYPGRSRNYAIIPQSFGETVKEEFPKVEDFCRLFYFQGVNVVSCNFYSLSGSTGHHHRFSYGKFPKRAAGPGKSREKPEK